MVPGSTSDPRQRTHNEPLYEIHLRTAASIEAFCADRTLETFGRSPMNDRLLSYPTTNVRALTRLE